MSNGDFRTQTAAVAATLRAVSEWGYLDAGQHADQDAARECARTDLRSIAGEVDGMSPDDMCCPLCEEMVCDEGCALEGLRDE